MLQVYRCVYDGTCVTARDDGCSECGRTDFDLTEISGAGKLVVWTTIHVPPTRYEDEAPYTVAMVDLDEGPLTMGRLEGGGARARGARVELTDVDSCRGPTFEPV